MPLTREFTQTVQARIATIGFEELSRRTTRPAKSLMRMLGPTGKPQASHFFEIIGHLKRSERLRIALSFKAEAL
jgi:hypothetical protein